MSVETSFQLLRDANPVPRPDLLHVDRATSRMLLETLQSAKADPPLKWFSPGWRVIAVAATALVAVGTGLYVFNRPEPVLVGPPVAPSATFEYRVGPAGGGDEGSGVALGTIETKALLSGVDECTILLGEVTATRTASGSASGSLELPVAMVLEEGAMNPTYGVCDISEIEAAGYRSLDNAYVTVGTPYPFYVEFQIHQFPAQANSFVIGGYGPGYPDSPTVYPDLLTKIPAIPTREQTPVPSTTPDSERSQFTYKEYRRDGTDGFGSEGEGLILGLVETALLAGNSGTCFVLLGTITPTKTELGDSSEHFTLPIFLTLERSPTSLSGATPEDGQCDVSEVREAGYMSVVDAEVTVGEAYPFYAELVAYSPYPAHPSEVIVGSFHGPATVAIETPFVDSIPTP